jgi:hypothetical protein
MPQRSSHASHRKNAGTPSKERFLSANAFRFFRTSATGRLESRDLAFRYTGRADVREPRQPRPPAASASTVTREDLSAFSSAISEVAHIRRSDEACIRAISAVSYCQMKPRSPWSADQREVADWSSRKIGAGGYVLSALRHKELGHCEILQWLWSSNDGLRNRGQRSRLRSVESARGCAEDP